MTGKAFLKCMIILLFSTSVLSALAAAPPLPPCSFYGYVYVGGRSAQDGLNVRAVISGTALMWTTETKNGTYGWPAKGSSVPDGFWIPSDDPETTEKDGGVAGDTIEFYVGGTQLTGQTATFESGGARRRDLSVPSAASNQSSLSVAIDCLTTYVGYTVKISGKLTDANGLGISGANLLATYATSGGPWKDIDSFSSTIDGGYHAEWMPTSKSENYSVKVSWEGNRNFERAEASINLAVAPLEEKYVFSVISDSTISEIAYNSTNKVLSFNLEGPSGTMGFTNVTIAKDLVEEIDGLRIDLDGIQTDYTTKSSSTAWLLHFTYQHSTHKVTISLTQSAPSFFETPFGIATLSGIIIIAVSILFVIRRRRRVKKPGIVVSGSQARAKTRKEPGNHSVVHHD